MLAFDIETEGFDALKHRITVACVYDPDAEIKKSFNFIVGGEKSTEDFLKCLDDADSICAFNGARFDIPFIVKRFSVPKERYEKWYAKLFDYFEVCKVVFNSSCSLNNLLAANGQEVKSSTGAQAVEWAKEEKWDELVDYCMADTILTHQISSMPSVRIPLTKQDAVMFTLKGDENDNPLAGIRFELAR